MKKPITIGISILLILSAVIVALGYINMNIIFNMDKNIMEAQIIKDEQPNIKENSTLVSMTESASKKSTEEAIADVQRNVSFRVLKPTYIPNGYILNIAQTSGTKFKGTSSEIEQAMLSYVKGNESLVLIELLIIKDDTHINTLKIPREFININGAKGRFLEESDGVKQLSWEMSKLNLTISSFAYNSTGVTGTSLSKEEMIKMAKSVK